MAVEPWYPRDWLSSMARASMSPAGRSAYRDLLDAAWLSGGRLPDNDRALCGLSGLSPEEWAAVRDDVLRYFPVVEPGWRANPRQVEEYRKAEAYRETRRAGGEARAAALSADRRSEIARAASDARWKHGASKDDPCSMLADACPPSPSPSPSPSPTPTPTDSPKQKETPSESCRREPTTLPPVVVMWNEKVAGTPLKSVRVWSSKRDRVLKARLREEGDLAVWGRAMDHLIASDFHRGVNDQGWVAGLDFLLQPSQAPKWLDLAHGGPPAQADPGITPQLRRLMGGVS